MKLSELKIGEEATIKNIPDNILEYLSNYAVLPGSKIKTMHKSSLTDTVFMINETMIVMEDYLLNLIQIEK